MIVTMVCMLVVITASVWVVTMEIYVYALFRKLFSISNECRLIHYHLPFNLLAPELSFFNFSTPCI